MFCRNAVGSGLSLFVTDVMKIVQSRRLYRSAWRRSLRVASQPSCTALRRAAAFNNTSASSARGFDVCLATVWYACAAFRIVHELRLVRNELLGVFERLIHFAR